MLSTHYRDGIKDAYRGETIGAQLYRRLANGCANRDQQAKLAAIADVERFTCELLKPIADRLGIVLLEAEWCPVVDQRSRELAALSWPEFIDKASRDWPPYIAAFEALKPLAPTCDEAAIEVVVRHEVALVEFAHLERAAIGSPSARLPLDVFLGR